MKPGITVIPFTSMTRAPWAAAVPAATDTILPSRTTTEPRSIAPPLPSRIRALVITRFCAAAAVAQNVRPTQTSHRFMRFPSPAESIHEEIVQSTLRPTCSTQFSDGRARRGSTPEDVSSQSAVLARRVLLIFTAAITCPDPRT